MNNHDVSTVLLLPTRYLWLTYTFPSTMDSHTHTPYHHGLTYTHSLTPKDSHTVHTHYNTMDSHTQHSLAPVECRMHTYTLPTTCGIPYTPSPPSVQLIHTHLWNSIHPLLHLLLQIITYVFSGQRLSPPTGCPKPVYRAMISCWWVKPWNMFYNTPPPYST